MRLLPQQHLNKRIEPESAEKLLWARVLMIALEDLVDEDRDVRKKGEKIVRLGQDRHRVIKMDRRSFES